MRNWWLETCVRWYACLNDTHPNFWQRHTSYVVPEKWKTVCTNPGSLHKSVTSVDVYSIGCLGIYLCLPMDRDTSGEQQSVCCASCLDNHFIPWHPCDLGFTYLSWSTEGVWISPGRRFYDRYEVNYWVSWNTLNYGMT